MLINLYLIDHRIACYSHRANTINIFTLLNQERLNEPLIHHSATCVICYMHYAYKYTHESQLI